MRSSTLPLCRLTSQVDTAALVLTGSVVGVVFEFQRPIGMGAFVIRHHRPKCSVMQRPFFSFLLQEVKLH